VIRELVLWLMLSAASFRLTRLVVKDTFPPVLWVRDRLAGGWRPMTEKEWDMIRKPGAKVPWTHRGIDGKENRWVDRASWSPYWLAELITCPWCASAYVSACVVGVTDIVIGLAWPWLMAFAVWAVAAPLAAREWS
jgi:hypothetical protein